MSDVELLKEQIALLENMYKADVARLTEERDMWKAKAEEANVNVERKDVNKLRHV